MNASIVTNEHLSWQNATLSGGHVVRSKVIQVKVIKRAGNIACKKNAQQSAEMH